MDKYKEIPLVSVLMTVYNREKYIAEAIESVINSSYQNWELIIVDDQSTDQSVAIARKYEQQDSRIKVYINEKNLGDYPNRNKAASYAKGKYLKYLDSDDLIYPHGLAMMVAAMEKYPEAGIGLTYNSYLGATPLPVLQTTEEAFINHFFKKGVLYIGPSGCIYRRQFFEHIGGFNLAFKVAADYEFNLRAASQSPIVLFARDLFWWRQHPGQEIINSNQNNEYIILNYCIHRHTLEQAILPDYLKSAILENNNILMGRRLLRLSPKLSLRELRRILRETGFPKAYFFKCFRPTQKI
ncbi:glycosyltransferase [Phaeodactylibacter luteus]|uniref:Glycosyltransferase n=1 Tax=Phaeodactylibacter luteus TaxID=1564516 RepID=A0A5C6RNL6_9BACT|nr:glycosyltransferase [Phaeodactylibacter luteus]TXB63807.1 glycosyltransferase [Phaeodactylibacter luteus]